MPSPNAPFLASLRLARPDLSEEDVQMLLRRHHGATLEFAESLVQRELVPRETVCRLWSRSIESAYVDPLVTVVTQEAIDLVPLEIARKAQVLGLYVIDEILTVVVPNPNDLALIQRLEHITGRKVSASFALPSEIHDAIEINYCTEEGVLDAIAAFERNEGNVLAKLSEQDLVQISESASLAKVVDGILYFAIKQRASDIHIDPREEYGIVRFRIDGRLQDIVRYSKSVHPAIISRLKILSRLNIAESRFPQDGRFSLPLGTNKADFRSSFLPAIYGNCVVLRILASTGRKDVMRLDQMFISQEILPPLRRLVRNPSGIFFVTGPTGSGKTTTLYAALQEINTPDLRISTIEDPVEVRLEGVVQSQVNFHIDLKFSTLMRSLLRQDPDVLLVGEIRDLETAKIATEAALTGHLVMSTLHTNTAIQAIVRLIEIGIEPYMVAPSIIGVLAQRLAARICDKCKEAYSPGPEILNKYFHDADDTEVVFYRGAGCQACRQTGYRGRIGFHELVVVSEEMRNLIAQNAGPQELSRAAARFGHRSLRYDGLLKVLLGLTTVDEIDSQTTIEWSV